MRDKKKYHLFRAGMVLLLFGFSIVLDWLLGLLGFPPEHYVHPANYTKMRKTLEFEYEFATNSQGLRFKEIALDKKPNEKRILVVGDSFTEGWGVEHNETFSALLESYYSTPENEVRFINAGLTGTGPLHYMYALFKVGIRYNIDGVLICLYANDVEDTPGAIHFNPSLNYNGNRDVLHAFLHSLYPRIYTLIKTVKNKPSQQDDIVKSASRRARIKGISETAIQSWSAKLPLKLIDAANRSQLNRGCLTMGLLYPDFWIACLDLQTELANRKWRNMKRILDLMINECRKRNLRVGVVFIPCAFLYNPDAYQETNPLIQCGTKVRKQWLTTTTQLQQNLYEWTNEIKVPYLDLTIEFRHAERIYDEHLNYPVDGHWTPLGHRIAAEAIAKWLNDNFKSTLVKTNSVDITARGVSAESSPAN